ncbi:cyclin-dependent protein kinase inhibitor [Pisolithus albus]|nr:cyclin-dependent protein kinase inhibitor [Pisolithus albus]
MEFFNDIGGDPLKPSLFELIAQEQLRDLLQPALKYVLAVFAQRYPRYLIRVVNRHEEFYAVIIFFVERYYLLKYNASFAERFYGLKRCRKPWIPTERSTAAVGGIPQGERLRDREKWRSLFFLVAVPYLRAKAHDYYEQMGGGVSSDVLGDGGSVRVPSDEVSQTEVFPWVNTAYEVWLLAYNVAYLFERSPFYRPWLAWIGVNLRRLGPEDFQEGLDDMQSGAVKRLRWVLFNSPRMVLDSLRFLLPTAIFFVKFLEWWYSPGSPARSLTSSPLGPAVPPPRMLPPHPDGIPVSNTTFGHCPLCKNAINNATALPSGYVFCYRCAFDHVEHHGTCPVTLLPTKPWQLRKVLHAARSVLDHDPRLKFSFVTLQFGKEIQAEQVPGWSAYYLDYKFLKKIISSLAANRPASEAAALALGIRPADIFNPSATQDVSTAPTLDDAEQPPILSSSRQDDDRGADFQAHKAAFFFKLERELEKINTFYLQKEAELKLRLETLLSKRRAAALRGLPDGNDGSTLNHVEWSAVEEGFRLLERDLGKLQINGTGFRKILKKWDKHSRSTTKELYLARQVEVQPVFNRQLISEFSDIDYGSRVLLPEDTLDLQLYMERNVYSGPFREFELDLRKAVENSDRSSIKDLVRHSDILTAQNGGKGDVTLDAPPELADLILESVEVPFDFNFVDDINGRTCLHEAAAAGAPRIVNLCLEKGSQKDRLDVYGRSALHYAAMHGHADVCKRLVEANVAPHVLDADNCSPLVYATLRGSVECVQYLVCEQCVSPSPESLAMDSLVPLSLASQLGHADVVALLLKVGAKCLPNTNGEYPIHLAAREGHAMCVGCCWIKEDGISRTSITSGHHSSMLLGMDTHGARADRTDEFGHQAIHYAAWYGHRHCVQVLFAAVAAVPRTVSFKRSSGLSRSAVDMQIDLETDAIPSLSLPPPAMPHRVYGHNYLDKNHLVTVTVGSITPSSTKGGVKLYSRLSESVFAHSAYLPSLNRLKMVITAGPSVNAVPYTVSLPQKNVQDTFVFQTADLGALSLEFSIYPNFGTKTIGRAVAHPSIFQSPGDRPIVLSVLDHRLHCIGEVTFSVTVTSPFQGVTLEVGGAVETYWKSLTLPQSGSPDSIHTSPSIQSTTGSPIHAVTLSSLSVQLTRDLHPVLYYDVLLPETSFDLRVADVTLSQFEALAKSLDCEEQLIRRLLPAHLGLTLEVVLSPRTRVANQYTNCRLDPNASIDAILRTIRQTSSLLGGAFARRRIAFTSFSPQVCAALNWKQPNYPVFFSSRCGQIDGDVPMPNPALRNVGDDYYASSVAAGVEFAKMNNLLGIFFDSELLLQVPSLIRGIRDTGLLVGIHGGPSTSNLPVCSADSAQVDAYIRDGTVTYMDNSAGEQM